MKLLKDNWPLIFVILLSAILLSCSSIRKSQSRTGSTSVVVIDSVHVKKYDTSSKTKESFDYYRETVIEGELGGNREYPLKSEKGELNNEKGEPTNNQIVEGGTSTVQVPYLYPVKTTIREWGKYNKDKIQIGSGYDSSSLKSNSETKVSTVQKTKEKDLIPWVPILLIALACLVARLGWWYISRK